MLEPERRTVEPQRASSDAADPDPQDATAPNNFSRRQVLGMGGALLAGGGLAATIRAWKRHEHGMRADVLIVRAEAYDSQLAALITDGLATLGVTRRQVRGKRILLKPNLVETASEISQINTNPAVVVAAAEAFRRLDAAEVVVAEGQGHRRDTQLVLEESGMATELHDADLPFVNLNHDDLAPRSNRGHYTELEPLILPRTVLSADWIVSMPKLKIHHWAGITCAMKNLFGVFPGIVYGWPKNVLHYQGINSSILDINATVRPAFAIVDGIIGMEGDGPIMGTAKRAGCLIMGRNPTAVDATAARVMGLNPYAVRYLTAASGWLGPIHPWNITQRGERVERVETPFHVPDWPHLPHLTTRRT